MSTAIRIRLYAPGEEPALFEVYHSAIHLIASRDYTPEQVEAWAPASLDPVLWRDRIRGIDPFVAELDGEIVGYADLQTSGYIDHFFVSGRHPRRGIGARLMERLLAEAEALGIATLTSDVSLTAQPFFARYGFEIVEQRCPVMRGIAIPNALMRMDRNARCDRPAMTSIAIQASLDFLIATADSRARKYPQGFPRDCAENVAIFDELDAMSTAEFGEVYALYLLGSGEEPDVTRSVERAGAAEFAPIAQVSADPQLHETLRAGRERRGR